MAQIRRDLAVDLLLPAALAFVIPTEHYECAGLYQDTNSFVPNPYPHTLAIPNAR